MLIFFVYGEIFAKLDNFVGNDFLIAFKINGFASQTPFEDISNDDHADVGREFFDWKIQGN